MTWEIITSLSKKGLYRYNRRSLCAFPRAKVDVAKLNPKELKYVPQQNEITFKTEQGDFYTFVQDEYDAGIFNYLKDFFEGKISFADLTEQIVKFKKHSQGEELSLVKSQLKKLDEPVSSKILEKYGCNDDRFNKIKFIILCAKNGDLRSQAILKELYKSGEFDVLADEYIYRYIGKSELDKILSGHVVEAGKGGHATNTGAFDVMTNSDCAYGPYRVKFRFPITTDKIQYHKNNNFYVYNVDKYDPNDASTVIVNNEQYREIRGTVLHTSPIETIKNFIDKFIAPLRRYSPKQDLLLSEDNMYKYLEMPLSKMISAKEYESLFGKDSLLYWDLIFKDCPLKRVISTKTERDAKVLDFLKQKYGINFSEPNMYRFVEQAEKDLVTAGKTVESGQGGHCDFAGCFDVTTDPYLNFNDFRLKLKSKLGDKDVRHHKNDTFYHLHRTEYTHNDVESIDACVSDKGFFRISE